MTEQQPQNESEQNLTLARNVKIGFFHLGSGMADVLTTGVWNRIMISDLGYSATVVGLLTGLRYFLAPIGIWAGRMSDQHRILGLRRLFWVWLGRFMMAMSTFVLGLSTAQLARTVESPDPSLWIFIVLSLLLFSFGSALSGATFLALIYDRSSQEQRGRAVGIVWTFLLLGFTVGGIFFSVLLPSAEGEVVGNLTFDPDQLQRMFLITGGIFIVLWFFSLLGEETRKQVAKLNLNTTPEEKRSLREDFRLVWENRTMRFFLYYLGFSMFFAFSQDAILEPFAGDVLDMDASITNRFAAYWGSTAIIGTLLFLWLSRRFKWLTNANMSRLGISFLLVAFALLTFTAFTEMRSLMTMNLIVLGVGLGIWNVGTLGLMMDLSPTGRAGTFLGFWTLVVTFSRGSGVATGGIMRDLFLFTTGDIVYAYGLAFGVATLGLILTYYCLVRVNIPKFRKTMTREQETATIFAGAMD